MNKLFALTKRNFKEIIRDPLSLVFCVGFPVAMLVLMQVIFMFTPEMPEIFSIQNYAVGICVFGYDFAMLFVALLISGDKNTEFINRLNMAPVRKSTYLLSYAIAMLPIVLAQTILFFAIALLFGLPLTWYTLLAIVYLLPSAIFYIVLGLLIGTLCKTEKQAGPVSSIFITASTLLGGVFMPIAQLGDLTTILNFLPFSHSVAIGAETIQGSAGAIWPHIAWLVGYTIAILLITIILFKRKK